MPPLSPNSLPNNFHIIIRGQVVQPYKTADALQNHKVVFYKPKKVTQWVCINMNNIGLIENVRQLNVHVFNIHHENHLILPLWRVLQENNNIQRGDIVVFEVNYIHPTHNKQDFKRTDAFGHFENKLQEMQSDFWK